MSRSEGSMLNKEQSRFKYHIFCYYCQIAAYLIAKKTHHLILGHAKEKWVGGLNPLEKYARQLALISRNGGKYSKNGNHNKGCDDPPSI